MYVIVCACVACAQDSLFFTDPYYAFLEKERFYDDLYTDRKSTLGYAGIYRLKPSGEVQLLDNSMERPNGLGLRGVWLRGLLVLGLLPNTRVRCARLIDAVAVLRCGSPVPGFRSACLHRYRTILFLYDDHVTNQSHVS